MKKFRASNEKLGIKLAASFTINPLCSNEKIRRREYLNLFFKWKDVKPGGTGNAHVRKIDHYDYEHLIRTRYCACINK